MATKEKKRRSPFDKDYAPYGTNEGPRGNADAWRAAFGEAWKNVTSEDIIGDDDPWSILCLEPGASKEEITKAFRKLLKENHPDKFPEAEKEEAGEKTKRILAAYDVLTKS